MGTTADGPSSNSQRGQALTTSSQKSPTSRVRQLTEKYEVINVSGKCRIEGSSTVQEDPESNGLSRSSKTQSLVRNEGQAKSHSINGQNEFEAAAAIEVGRLSEMDWRSRGGRRWSPPAPLIKRLDSRLFQETSTITELENNSNSSYNSGLSRLLPANGDHPLLAAHEHVPERPEDEAAISASSKSDLQTLIDQHVTCLPVARLFDRDSAPLILPRVDAILEAFGGASRFTEDKLLPWGADERVGYDEWVSTRNRPQRRGRFRGLWLRLAKILSPRKSFTYVDLDKQSASESECDSTQLMPPFHLIPDSVTVTDLKRNRRKPAGFIGNWQDVWSAAINAVLAAAGSAKGIELTRVEMWRDLVQMLTLLMSSLSSGIAEQSWYRTVFVTVPSAISLDFVSAFGQALVWLWTFTFIGWLAVYELWRLSGKWHGIRPRELGEGLDQPGIIAKTSWRESYAWKVAVSFIATSLFLPLSKISLGALFWTQDYWVQDRIGIDSSGANNFDPADFCYRTTMRRPAGTANFNWAWIVLPIAGFTVLVMTIFLPWRLHRVVQNQRPSVDAWTELGEKRRDVEGEYRRLLDDDPSPFSFLYRDYRRRWSSFKALYMLIKLANILLIVIVSKDNCLFHNSRTAEYLAVVQQGCLLAFMTLFLLAMLISKPFIDYISNNSDVVSRFGYVLISLVGLLVALEVPGHDALNNGALTTINVIVYGLNGYFTVIGTDLAQRQIKRLQARLDISIDIFSPQLDLAKHIHRRIWQETLSILLLAAPEYRMPVDRRVEFFESEEGVPYLLDFEGSVAERHVENLKILRSIGLEAYASATLSETVQDEVNLKELRSIVQRTLTGPDIYFCSLESSSPAELSSHFGRVDVYPFPFVAVFRYDQQPRSTLQLKTAEQLSQLIRQNSSASVQAARRVRLALRALDGQLVLNPYIETRATAAQRRHRLEMATVVTYRFGKLQIAHNSTCEWRGYNYSSGFDVSVSYANGREQDQRGQLQTGSKRIISSAELGITEDFRLTPQLAKLFFHNKALLQARLPLIEDALAARRAHFHAEMVRKRSVLSYSFLLHVAGDDNFKLQALEKVLQDSESSKDIRALPVRYGASLKILSERIDTVKSSAVHAWWYLLWDDIWRRNKNVPSIRKHESFFSPYYRQSICYQPLSRTALEEALRARDQSTGTKAYFHPGFVNQIYFHLEHVIFSGSSEAKHVEDEADRHQFVMNDLANAGKEPQQGNESQAHLNIAMIEPVSRFSAGTGDGTDHDATYIRPRHAFKFEQLWDTDQGLDGRKGLQRKIKRRLARWFGLEVVRYDGRTAKHTSDTMHYHVHKLEDASGVMVDVERGSRGWKLTRG